MTALYNECEPFAAAWLRELIKADLIAPGVVDERPIQELKPSDVEGFTQFHAFAGIGVWSFALRAAGWPDDRPVWTGSCPCQPFSAAGRRKGTADDRHLWPVWFPLIRECRPDVVFGEQVQSPDGLAWLDLVSADMEAADYTIGALGTSAAGVGAPHARCRLYFVAQSERAISRGPWWGPGSAPDQGSPIEPGGSGEARALADAERCRGGARGSGGANGRATVEPHRHGRACGVADSGRPGDERWGGPRNPHGAPPETVCETQQRPGGRVDAGDRGATRGFWIGAEWIPCRDGKRRPVEPGVSPLASGTPARMGRLRGYGNALNAEQAKAFVAAYLDVVASREATA